MKRLFAPGTHIRIRYYHMEIQGKETKTGMAGERPLYMTVIYGILVIMVIVAAIILVAKFAFNVELVNFDQLLGARITKSDLLKLQ
jgi:hypothetical protein